MEHVLVVVVCDTVAVKPSAVTVIGGPTTPLVVLYAVPRLLVYFTESAKYASSAVIRLRRSDFIDARYAFSFVFANFGIAIAAKMPMITTTIRSSISVKPLRFIPFPLSVRCGFPTLYQQRSCRIGSKRHRPSAANDLRAPSTLCTHLNLPPASCSLQYISQHDISTGG